MTGWRARGHAVGTVSVLDVGRRAIGEFRVTGLPVHWRRIAHDLASYDVINLHGPVPTLSDAFLLLTAPRRARRPRLLYTHHSDIHLEAHPRASAAYNRVHERLARLADHIVTTSRAYADRFGAGGRPVSVIPWGVDVDRFSPGERHPPAGGGLRVLFVGQMRPYKGVEILLRAVARRPGISATLVGGGPLEEAYARQASELGADNVRFVGRVHDDRLPELYAAHDVVVLPSTTRAEAFGLVLLEGMAAGCVPLASDLPGVRDVAGRTGVLVRPGDVDDLRSRLEWLAADRTRTWRMGTESQRAVASMRWDSVVRRYEDVMLELTAASSGRTCGPPRSGPRTTP
jgi:rhamnosyl/mannosyltransferase